MKTKNAKIEKTMLGIEDHGVMTCMLYLDYNGSGQGFGGWCLDSPVKDDEGKLIKREGTRKGLNFIMQILKVLEVENWEDLPGTYCRIEGTDNKVYRIGHLLKDKWFDPATLGFKNV